ncbi:hypothetical protein FLA_2096 [Filimonas lacunae]|nr:hypothetical protein FLA_2096 [Filimonas lacunae]
MFNVSAVLCRFKVILMEYCAFLPVKATYSRVFGQNNL